MASREIEVIARGLAVHNGRVLVCRDKQGGYAYLPGGHVEFGESAAEALAREFVEESGLAVRVGALLLAGEHRFTQQGKKGPKQKHEINLVFHVEPDPGSSQQPGGWPDEPPTVEDHIRFEWIDPAAAVDADIRPESAKALIASGGAVGSAWISEGEA